MERAAEFKSEYDEGVVVAMSGASSRHNLIVAALIHSLMSRVRDRCLIYPSDMKVRIPNRARFFYPNVSVVRDDPQFADDEQDVLLNPLIVHEARVEHYRRKANHWLYKNNLGLEATVDLPALGCELPLREIYSQVDFSTTS